MSLSLSKKRKSRATNSSLVNQTTTEENEEDVRAKRAKRANESQPFTEHVNDSDASTSVAGTVASSTGSTRESTPATGGGGSPSTDVVASSESLSHSISFPPINRCGKIKWMQLLNFMCHEHLRIDFAENINFLVGSNGSGKSAIIAALVLGLTGKAKATNRGGSSKTFIKTGENSCKIEVALTNDGPASYNFHLYGGEIIISRTISHTSASLSLKSIEGKVISRKSEDLAGILLYHNIQVDNTAFVLNQDSAREFLKEFEPSKNYNLFLKATQIEVVMEKLNDCLVAHKAHKHDMEFQRKRAEYTKEELKELKQKLAQLVSAQELAETISNREGELLWIQVSESEIELKVVVDKIGKLEERKSEISDMIRNKDSHHSELNENVGALRMELDAKAAEYNVINNNCIDIKTKMTKAQQTYAEVKSHIDSIEKRKRVCSNDMQDLNSNIDERSSRNIRDVAEIRKQNEEVLETLKASVTEKKTLIQTAKIEYNTLLTSKFAKEEELRKFEKNRRDITDNMSRISQQIRVVKTTTKDKLSLFGEHMPLLKAEIEKYMKAGRFTARPVGPIGHYIEVKNKNYRNIIEQQLNTVLNAFIVDNKKDCNTLEEIFRKKFPTVRKCIITTKFHKQVHDVSGGKVNPPEGTHLLMDEIKCEDPVVMNCLIDRLQIETILLTDSKSLAENICSHLENVPKNFRRIIVPKYGLEYYPEPNYRMYSIKVAQARFIQVDIEERVNQMEAERASYQQQTEELRENLNELLNEMKNDAILIGTKKAEIEHLDKIIRELLEKITDLQNVDYPEFNEVDILKRELAEKEKEYRMYDQKLQEKLLDLQRIEQTKLAFQEEYEAQQNAKKVIENGIAQIKNQLEAINAEIRSFHDKFRKNQAKLSEINAAIKQLENERKAKDKNLNEILSKAGEHGGDRVEVTRSSQEVIDELRTLKAKLKQRSQLKDDPEKLRDVIRTKELSLKAALIIFDNLDKSISMLKLSLISRFNFVKKLKQHMVMLLQFTFTSLLSLRNFSGNIDVDHQGRTMDVTIIPRDNKVKDAVSSTKALSGGERSYSTVSFLLSLWTTVDHPFFFLDEYDVFTDEVNREYITRLLIKEGSRKAHRQYIYLTPLDMNIESSKEIKIHRLLPPNEFDMSTLNVDVDAALAQLA